MKTQKEKAESGQTLIEPLLAIAIFGILLAPFIGSINNMAQAQLKYRHQTEAVQYTREGLEIIYNAAANADDWEVFVSDRAGTTTTDAVGRFTREIKIAKAKRDGSGNLDEVSGTDDKKTLRVVAKVSWDERDRPEEIELTTYLIELEAF